MDLKRKVKKSNLGKQLTIKAEYIFDLLNVNECNKRNQHLGDNSLVRRKFSMGVKRDGSRSMKICGRYSSAVHYKCVVCRPKWLPLSNSVIYTHL